MIVEKLRLIIKKVLGVTGYESIIFFLKNGYWPNFKNPETFNEKISSRKINSGDKRFVRLSDKYKVRSYIKEKIGEEYLTDIYATYVDSKSFSIDRLPNQFVLKANHASGENFIKIIRSKKDIDEQEIKNWIEWALKQNYGDLTNEWWYKKIKPRKIIAEELLNPEGEDLRDYKFFVVNGKVELIQVDQSRFKNHKRNLYDTNWNQIQVEYKYPTGDSVVKPKKFEKMKEIVLALAKGFQFSRIDLYLTQDLKIKFGELTFAPEAGWGPFKPHSFDKKMGKKIDL